MVPTAPQDHLYQTITVYVIHGCIMACLYAILFQTLTIFEEKWGKIGAIWQKSET